MSSRKRARKAQQQKLTFEPVATAGASSSSPLPSFGRSPARVRFSSPRTVQESSPSRTQTASPFSAATRRRKRKPRQQTLESSLEKGKGKTKNTATTATTTKVLAEDDDSDVLSSATARNNIAEQRRRAVMSPPRSSIFGSHQGRRKIVVDSDSETPVEEDGTVTDRDGEGPPKHDTPQRERIKSRPLPTPVVAISSDEHGEDDQDGSDDEESENEVQAHVRSSQSLPNHAAPDEDEDDVDLPVRTPRSSMPGQRRRPIIDVDEDVDEDDEIQTPAKRRRLTRQKAAPVSESDSDTSSANSSPVQSRSKGKGKATLSEQKSSPPASTARSMRSGARKHRSQREKRMELLRRHKAGEKELTIEDINTSEEEEDGALYDTDSDHQVLEVFDDESETEEPVQAKEKAKKKAAKKKNRRAREASVLDEDADSEDENFIDDDDDTLGVPDEALHLIPLEFTRASTKPLKLHFKDAVEWLIHRRINPGFDKDNEVYVTAWRKLSDEVTGLANSKFISSVWRPDFHKALKARPYIEQEELGASALATEFDNCQACGRSGHPATWTIRPWGKPYDPKTLDEVESDSEDEDEDEEHGDRDANGNIIPSEDTKFSVGQTCNSNAETAHSLMHWKVGLRDWVEAHLEGQGYFEADQVLEREHMKAKARHKVADQIVVNWEEGGVIQGLFGDFQATIESARNKDPTKVSRGRRW
ncbi:hypothetical protein N0V93_004819 [Gnomoniopsis smithogilvyi]|uniref:DUF4211 domain-containing protein n=1 Tax=Gnomoniopsis smithogilvyi TaxID=1191159 RepID=A0A9W9CW60_9PEZI|nr:hypothetical protein N0V93_004819 [Gnomoniopsis smithogilvyi]